MKIINTKINFKKKGEIKLRNIVLNDIVRIFEILDEKEKMNRDIVLEILHNQLIEPEISLVEFKRLSGDNLIKIGKVFIENEDYTFKDFKDTGDFYKDFFIAIKKIKEQQLEYIERIVESYKPALEKASQAASKVLETLPLARIIEQAARAGEQIARIGGNVSKILEAIDLESIGEMVIGWQNFCQKWINQNRYVFENITMFWANVLQNYKISPDQAIPVLKKYKWFITPSLPINIVFYVIQIEESKGEQEAVDNLFIKYFSANNWQKLDEMVDSWENSNISKERLKIIKDCLEILKLDKSNSINEVNVILPTLIAQIDGALTDYLNSQNIQWDCYYEDYIKNGRVEKVGRKSQFRRYKPVVLTTKFDELTNTIFLDTLFQSSQRGQQLELPLDFIRHKIVKGEIVTYGKKDYLIRAFMLLDYIANIPKPKIINN